MAITSATLVYNPGSGKHHGKALANNFVAAWRAKQPQTTLSVFASHSADHFAELAGEHYKANNTLILMGGDGSFSLGLSALFGNNSKKKLTHPIGFLPAGSGNSFLRDFGITNFEQAQNRLFQALNEGRSQAIDCGRFDFNKNGQNHTRYFINIWAIGLISDINLLATKLGKSYTAATLLKIPVHHPYKYNFKADDNLHSYQANFLAVCNSKYTGGAMQMAPMANVSDGLFDAIVPCIKGRLGLLGLFPSIFQGKHIKSRHIKHFSFKSLSLDLPKDTDVLIDGEMDTADSVKITMMPASWTLLV